MFAILHFLGIAAILGAGSFSSLWRAFDGKAWSNCSVYYQKELPALLLHFVIPILPVAYRLPGSAEYIRICQF
jgi:hypothetical protein